MPSPKLRIAEIFASVQGEGMWTGTPSTFVRVSGCNLRCAWCDTPYASWSPEGTYRHIADILDKVESLGTRHVVVTGGEPMLFEPIVNLTRELKTLGYTITIETAGTVYQPVSCDLMSISPKLSNSRSSEDTDWRERHERTRINLDVLSRLVSEFPYQLKFVAGIDEAAEVLEIENLLGRIGDVDPNRVLLMAEGVDAAILRQRQRRLVPICMERGWRICHRLHIELFGNARGT